MPFEQRSVTYFICKNCNYEYPIMNNLEYGKIYECSQNGCNYKETFMGLPLPTTSIIASSLNLSPSPTDEEAEKSFFIKIWHNTLFQGILSGLIVFILLAIITFFIANSLFGRFKAELLEEIRTEIVSIREKE